MGEGEELGLCIRSVDLTPQQFIEVAKRAEELGYSSLWMTEEMSRASPITLAAAALHTKRIKLGAAILNIFARTPMATAMEAATLQELSQNRFILGLGVGGPDISRKGHGADISNPVQKMSEYIEIVRKFLTGERLNYAGRHYRVDGVRLWIKQPRPTEIYLAALNPQMLTLAGAKADGLILNLFDPRAAEYVHKAINKGLKNSHDQNRPFKKFSFVLAAASSEPEYFSALKRSVAFYLSSPAYRRIMREAGHGEAVERFATVLETRGREAAVETIDDDVVESVSVICDRDVSDQLERYRKAGVTPLIYPQPRPGNEYQDILSILAAAIE
ncbi:Putative coenzyme F420-dependent oxidoreductase [archaeon HR03]|nr:Putative coenzyme F420-dependent oxidoreductase [archaeon HR03]